MLVDTAGMRRQSKVADSVEYYTALRSQRAAERADVALVVCDAGDGVTAQDLRIAELAMKAGCATAIVLNKWDMQEQRRRRHGVDASTSSTSAARVAEKLRLRPRVLTASAKTGRHVAAPADRGDRARRPHGRADPHARAQPLPLRGRAGAPAAGRHAPRLRAGTA